MIDARKDYGKLHLILELIDRQDLREALDKKFSQEEQTEIFHMFKEIMADEITFVMTTHEQYKKRSNNQSKYMM